MHLVDPVTHERGVLEVQIGSQLVRQVHAHLLSGLSMLHHVYLTSYALYYWYTQWMPYLVNAAS